MSAPTVKVRAVRNEWYAYVSEGYIFLTPMGFKLTDIQIVPKEETEEET